MAEHKCFLILLGTLLLISSFSNVASSPNNIFILGGQSNMAGRGGVQTVNGKKVWDGKIPPESQSHPSIHRFTPQNRWEVAREPLHRDIDYNKTNGIGPGMAFANELRVAAGRNIGVIGLVPCAIGGTYIREWMKGTQNYTRLLNRIVASQSFGGKVRALFWFQGESDSSAEKDAKFYETNLIKFITDLRNDLHYLELPVILVKIAATKESCVNTVRNADDAVKRKVKMVETLDARESISNWTRGITPDHIHLTTESLITLGKMLAHSFLSNFAQRNLT